MLKLRWKTVLGCCLSLAALAGILAIALSRGSGEQSEMAAVEFLQPSGFYDDDFYLELRGYGDPIYYTVDSTDPDINSTLYTGPIHIGDASPNENVYSARTDTSPYFDRALIERNKAELQREYFAPERPVDKATVIRATCIDASGQRGPISTAVYFVGIGEKQGYKNLNIITITTDPANLFDDNKGIYVQGSEFKNALVDGIVQSKSKPFFWPANYNKRGREWEREANIQCFDPQGNLIFAGPCGIRTQGHATRGYMPKNLNIYARREYGCAAFDTGSLFSREYVLNRLNLFYGWDDLMITDYLINEKIDAIDVTKRECAPCAMFLDGEYWGVFWLSPRFKEDYLSQAYGVKEDNIVVIKNGGVEVGEKEDIELYRDMVSYISDNDMRSPEAFEKACELIDMQSFIDYFATEIYVANNDWPNNNYALWRSRQVASGALSDGRWRWILFDMDHGLKLENAEADIMARALKLNTLFASLMRNEDFQRMFTDRLLEMATDVFAPERMDVLIDNYKADMAQAIEKKYQRFCGKDYTLENNFYKGCEDIKTFLRKRQAYILKTYGGEEK